MPTHTPTTITASGPRRGQRLTWRDGALSGDTEMALALRHVAETYDAAPLGLPSGQVSVGVEAHLRNPFAVVVLLRKLLGPAAAIHATGMPRVGGDVVVAGDDHNGNAGSHGKDKMALAEAETGGDGVRSLYDANQARDSHGRWTPEGHAHEHSHDARADTPSARSTASGVRAALGRVFGRGSGSGSGGRAAHDKTTTAAVGHESPLTTLGKGARVAWGEHEQQARASLRHLFGRDLADHEVAALVGARPGDTVRVGHVFTSGNHHSVGLKLEGANDAYGANRTILPAYDRSGNHIIGVGMSNNAFYVYGKGKGKGVGTEVFSRQVAALSALGVRHIDTRADKAGVWSPDRGFVGPHNGFYTWARLGYDATLKDIGEYYGFGTHVRETPELRGAKTVRDIVRTPHIVDTRQGGERISGAQWWLRYGVGFDGRFDLMPGSRSMQTLEAYLHEKGQHMPQLAEPRDSERVPVPVTARGVGEEIEWTAEDEHAANRAWALLNALWQREDADAAANETMLAEAPAGERAARREDGDILLMGRTAPEDHIPKGAPGAGQWAPTGHHERLGQGGHEAAGGALRAQAGMAHAAGHHVGGGGGAGGGERERAPHERTTRRLPTAERVAAAAAQQQHGQQQPANAHARTDALIQAHRERIAALEAEHEHLMHAKAEADRRTVEGLRQANAIARAHGNDLRHPEVLAVRDEALRHDADAARYRQQRDETQAALATAREELDRMVRARGVAARGGAAPLELPAGLGTRPNAGKQPQAKGPDETTDEHGQQMPFSYREFAAAWPSRTPTDAQAGNINDTNYVTLKGREYVAKAVERQFVSEYDQQRNEAATVAGMGALDAAAEAPAEAYHLGFNGQSYSVISREAGSARTDGREALIAQIVPEAALQRAFLASYALGMSDRHGRNIVVDATTSGFKHIDFGFGFRMHTAVPTTKNATLRILGLKQGGISLDNMVARRTIRLDRAEVKRLLDHEATLTAALAPFALHEHETEGLRARFTILRALYDESGRTGRPLTLGDLLDAAGDVYE